MSAAQQRRSAKRFEPPPWEREQFEELVRAREEKPAEDELAEAVAALAPNATDPAPVDAAEEPPRAAEAEDGAVKSGQPDDDAVAAMMMQLRHEEPDRDDSLWKIGVAFSGIAAVIGSVLVVWGIAALLKSGGGGAAALIGGSTLLLFGGLFVGVGMWLAVRSLKQRGVL